MNDESDREARLTLELLNAIEARSDVSQRHLARNMGVALGLANSYLKRCVRKGYVKIREAPANRFLYYLTPKGFAEKSRLTARYLSTSLSFYRQAAESCTRIFDACLKNGHERVLLCGLSDLAEIAILRSAESYVRVVGIYDRDSNRTHFFSRPVWKRIEDADEFDVCMLTDLRAPLESYRHLVKELEPDRICVPETLGLGAVVKSHPGQPQTPDG